MKQPLVSIIIPVFNVQQYLVDCLESVLMQTYENIEVIIVDDGSTDNSAGTCDDYAKKDSRIKAIHQKNLGVSAARNAALRQITGDYVVFVDADDVTSPEMVATLLDGFQSDDVGMTICGFTKITNMDDFDESSGPARFEALTPEEVISEVFYGDKIGSGPFCKMMRTADVEDIYFDKNIKVGEDLDFLVSALLANEHWTINYTDKSLYGYRIREGSAMNSGFSKKDMDYLELVKRLGSDVVQKYPNTKKAVAYRTFGVASYCAGRIKNPDRHSEDMDICNKELKRHSFSVLVDGRTSLKDRCLALAYMVNVSLASRLRRIA